MPSRMKDGFLCCCNPECKNNQIHKPPPDPAREMEAAFEAWWKRRKRQCMERGTAHDAWVACAGWKARDKEPTP